MAFQSNTPCRNGPECWRHKQGICNFSHRPPKDCEKGAACIHLLKGFCCNIHTAAEKEMADQLRSEAKAAGKELCTFLDSCKFNPNGMCTKYHRPVAHAQAEASTSQLQPATPRAESRLPDYIEYVNGKAVPRFGTVPAELGGNVDPEYEDYFGDEELEYQNLIHEEVAELEEQVEELQGCSDDFEDAPEYGNAPEYSAPEYAAADAAEADAMENYDRFRTYCTREEEADELYNWVEGA